VIGDLADRLPRRPARRASGALPRSANCSSAARGSVSGGYCGRNRAAPERSVAGRSPTGCRVRDRAESTRPLQLPPTQRAVDDADRPPMAPTLAALVQDPGGDDEARVAGLRWERPTACARDGRLQAEKKDPREEIKGVAARVMSRQKSAEARRNPERRRAKQRLVGALDEAHNAKAVARRTRAAPPSSSERARGAIAASLRNCAPMAAACIRP